MEIWDDTFKGRHYPPSVILLSVRWYCKYPLAYRHVEEMLKDRGFNSSIDMPDHSTIERWVKVYGPEIEKRLRRQPASIGSSWRVDETYIKVRGKWVFLYRAVDKQGNTVDFLLSEKQDKAAAQSFFEKALKKKANPKPEKLTTDGHQAYPASIKNLKKKKKLKKKLKHRVSKYLNNHIESDHARLKQKLKPMRGFKTFQGAEKTIAGMEAMLMLKKRQFTAMNHYKSEVLFVNSLFQLIA
jgi:transposase, IS6 family